MKIVNGINDINPTDNSNELYSNNTTIYANRVIVGGKDGSLFEENAYTILYTYENKAVLDANGKETNKVIYKENKQLEAIITSKETTTDIISERNSIHGTKLKLQNTTTITAYVNGPVSPLLSNEIYIYTIGKPLDNALANEGEQEIFIARRDIPSHITNQLNNAFTNDTQGIAIDEMEDLASMTKLELIDIGLINNVSNSGILFSKEQPIINSGSNNLTIEYDESFAMSMQEGINMYATLNGVYQKVKNNDNPSTVFGNQLYPIKLIPIADKNNITCINETQDFNINVPWEFLSQAFEANKYDEKDLGLRQFIVQKDANGVEISWSVDLWQTFLSMFALTKAYATGFANYQIKGTDGRSGINPDATIGGMKIGLLSGTNATDALPSIDGRIETWKQNYPQYVNTQTYRIFKAFIGYLGEYLQSSYCIGNGLNRSNRLSNLFYFELQTSITGGYAGTETGNASDPKNDIFVKVKSEFFEFGKQFTAQQHLSFGLKSDLNRPWNYKSINLDGYMSLADTPKQWQAMNRPTKPGSVNITSDDISRFYFYTPINVLNRTTLDESKLLTFYGKTKKVSQPGYKEKIITINHTSQDNGAYNYQVDWSYIPAQWNGEGLWDKARMLDVELNGHNDANHSGNTTLHEAIWYTDENGYPIPDSAISPLPDHRKTKKYGLHNMDGTDLYNKFLKPIIGENTKIEKVGGVPRVELYKVGTAEGQSGFDGPSNVSAYDERYCISNDVFGCVKKDVYAHVKYSFKLRYYEYDGDLTIDDMVSANAIMDKTDYMNLVSQNIDKTLPIAIRWNFDASPGDRVNKIELNGLWGNEFTIKINDTVIAENIDFVSRYDETQTTTKINL